MSKKLIRFNKEHDGSFTAFISPVQDWAGFDKLISYLEKYFNAIVTMESDGPDARRWILIVNEIEIELIHDDSYGNYLKAPSLKSEMVIREIADDLEERFGEED